MAIETAAFQIDAVAFPVAPANLDGFTLDEFQWMGGPEPVEVDVIPGGKFRRPVWSWDRVWRFRTMPNELPVDTLVGAVGEVVDYVFDFSKAPELKAGTGLTISSVGIVDDGGDLTIGTPTVLAAAAFGVPIGKGVVVRASDFEDDTIYRLACLVTLSNGVKLLVPGRIAGVADVEVEVEA